jgi:Subtilase family
VTSTGADKALSANHSWNTDENIYNNLAKLLDDRVVDAAPATAGAQAMLMVVSAGNNGKFGQNTVLAPATAKNVLSAGATQNYRPSTQAGAPTNSCANPSISFPEEFTREANNIAEVGAFSSQGPVFGRLGLGLPLAHTVFIAPTVVAPGGRVFSATPFQSTAYACSNLCRVEWPASSFYTFSSGTSFSAPVVTGVAALLRKWFLDRGVSNPAPSLIKADVIATATDLGPSLGGDYRPSYRQGWGRVNLDRATDAAVARFYVNENAGLSVTTGIERSWTRTIDSDGRDTLIVLVWSDPSSPETNGHPPVINDLRLRVDLVGGNLSWYGNNFGENIDGNDNGYSHPYVTASSAASDAMNNVEAIFIPAGTFSPGRQIQIRVTGANVPQGPQKFSVYAYNVRLSS